LPGEKIARRGLHIFTVSSVSQLFYQSKFDEAVKSRKSDGTVKRFRCKARKSDGMRRTYLYAAMTEDAVQRRRWTFYEAVKFNASLYDKLCGKLIN
jgi:hypothetical protein